MVKYIIWILLLSIFKEAYGGDWAQWQNWSACQDSSGAPIGCGRGNQHRSRTCADNNCGAGAIIEVRPCLDEICPTFNCQNSSEIAGMCKFDYSNSCVGDDNCHHCICKSEGFKVSGDQCYNYCVEVGCDEEIEGVSQLKRYCGDQAISCTGTVLNRTCLCNPATSYPSKDGQYCYEATCKTSQEFMTNCGAENSCQGTNTSFVCECNGFGYGYEVVANVQNRKKCKLLSCEDGDLNPLEICGQGATACTGNVHNLTCACNVTAGYIPSEDKKSCIPMPCNTDPAVGVQCLPRNTCEGSKIDWRCICSAYGFRNDPTDPKKCIEAKCDDPNIDILGLCGTGVTSCTGFLSKRRCVCNTTENYIPTLDGSHCMPAPCNANENATKDCGGENSCIGSFDSYMCVCNGYGFQKNATINKCEEVPCSSLPTAEVQRICGFGALSCDGTIRNPVCNCNNDLQYYASEDMKSCIEASCSSKADYDSHCGNENSCVGNITHFECICETEGYKPDPSNKKKCILESCELNEVDVLNVCGKGAISCKGNVRDLECVCDASKGYVQSPDTNKCEPSSCYGNATVSEQCGEENHCLGDLSDWICVCDAYGYKVNATNSMTCDKVMCGDTGADAVTVCGKETTSCSGHIAKPVCTCNETAQYLPSPDSTRCVKASCKENDAARKACVPGNSCSGSYDEFICICDQFSYHQDPADNRKCIREKCEDLAADYDYEKICGVGGISCTGYVNQPVCVCNSTESYHPSNDRTSCVKASCSTSDAVRTQCGLENSCFGDIESFMCDCKAHGYKLEPINKTSCVLATCEDGDFSYHFQCGKGAVGCSGNINTLSCLCDSAKGYVPSADMKRCVPNSCKDNPDVYIKCGMENTCLGSYADWFCVCSGAGYEANPADPKSCQLMECSKDDAIHVCGYGAIDCKGPVLAPTCSCNYSDHYIASEDGTSCVPITCRKNDTARAQCGEENTCKGHTDNFKCICDAYGFKADNVDHQKCVERQCTDGDADIIRICGHGGIRCTGPIRSAVCECNSTEYYYPNADRSRCILASCKANETIMKSCGEFNSCEGNMESHICVCNGPGYKHHPSDDKQCVKETCEMGEIDPIYLCGKGAVKCNGTYDIYTCECDNAMGYVQAPDGNSCKPFDCHANATMHKQCGDGNRCIGSLTDWICVCDVAWYKPDPSNLMRCHEKTCKEADLELICGTGATGCSGSATNPTCECDSANYFVSSTDRRSCIKASCKTNITAVQQCGDGNSCYGTPDNYVCNCDAYGYRLDDNNNQACVEKKCDDVGANYVEICGLGGIGCKGTVKNPVCECDQTKHYVASPDSTSCVLSNCRGNKTVMAACGNENKCFGSASSFICVCDGPGYKRNPSNLQECLPETCEAGEIKPHMVCGRGATACKGTMYHFECECNNTLGFIRSPGHESCIPVNDCYANATMHEQCGEGNGCQGSVADWICKCDAPGYKPHKTNFQMCHQRMCSDADIDLVEVCGVGVESCVGPIANPTCNCDTSKHYVLSADSTSCIPGSCKTNETIMAQCGEGNSCSGTSENFVCICNGYGYRPHETDKQTCVLKKCSHSDVNAVDVCGQGALSCIGTMRDPICQCNNDMFFIPSDDSRSCVLASCSANSDVAVACGKVNGCFGSKSSWICDCSSPGTMLNPNNIRECLHETCESGKLDPIIVCGKGALGCNGTMSNVTCECDNSMGYVQSPNGMSCVASDCKTNSTMHELCGDGNSCVGSLTDWMCVCDAPGYHPHPSDPMRCLQKMCSHANINPVDVCGIGATKCVGSITEPRCTCDTAAYYVPSPDGTYCIPGSCQTNKTALEQCGNGNTCTGTADNFVCICNAPGYKLDDSNNKRCIEISCNDADVDLVEICGQGSIGCIGTARQPVCQCDHSKHFVPSLESTSCQLASCRANDTIMDRCRMGNTCFGSMTSHICVCEAKGFKVNPSDPTECVQETCEDKDIDALSACGKGATDCMGTLMNLTCQCDGASYVESPDKTSCLPVGCQQNVDVKKACGEGNTCEGSYDDWVCLCTNPEYIPHATDEKVCSKKKCTDNPIGSCGIGATSCSGNVNIHKCTCNLTAGYMPSKDEQSCIPIDCKMNPKMNCGFGNTCRGSFFSYVCECNTLGTMRNISNPKQCIEVDCSTDAVSICGVGATGCAVTPTNDVNCTCGEFYHPAHDYHSCVLDDCKFNKLVPDACGVENECTGSISSWMCVCKGPKYIQDIKSTQLCAPGPCRIEQCGSGKASGSFQYYAESCSGTYFEPTCNCKEGFEKDSYGGCIVKSCSRNNQSSVDCNDGAISCEGTYFKYKCECRAPTHILNPANKRSCIPARCNPQLCGRGLVNGDYMDFASECSGSYTDFTCKCKYGLYGSGTSKCSLEKRTCALSNDCHPNANCIDYDGHYFKCECKDGYSGDGYQCHRNGGLTPWSVVQPCDKTCGTGYAQVMRTCDDPKPDTLGKKCNVPSPDVREVPCHQFACTACSVKKTCECENIRPYFVHEYVEPDESLKYFTNLTAEDVEKALSAIEKWKLSVDEKEFCIKHTLPEIDGLISDINENLRSVDQTKLYTITARDMMRNKLDCNVDLEKKDKYFRVYEAIVKRHFILKQVVSDLQAKEKLMVTYRSSCTKDSKVGWLSSIFS